MPIQSCGQSVSARRGKRYTEIGQFIPTPVLSEDAEDAASEHGDTGTA